MVSPAFTDRMRELGLDMSLYNTYPRKSLYILRNEDEIVSTFALNPVPWAKACYWADDPKKIEHLYHDSVFIQDAASVVPVLALDVTDKDMVIDLCAAPGSKTLHLVRTAKHVIACDSHSKRVKRLEHTMRRFHIANCTIVHRDGRRLQLTDHDRVLVDAPCTGEGMVGKIHKVLKMWSVKRIKVMAKIQKQLLVQGLSLVKEGGILVYSTCTFAPEENEGVVDSVLRKRNVKLEPVSIENLHYIPGLTCWQKKEYDPSLEKTIRIYPHHNDTNGFFVAKFRKV
ncbi:MAG: RsmB/NOP family class I SAM-dependent RNA methyltransferase [Theionarchaea archaeon]|nr:RsmB/NOP family class I SAM-dependent RNA methyltransferase [Theionarchaea archaeon]